MFLGGTVRGWALLVVGLLALSAPARGSPSEVRVDLFSPLGTVKQVRQATARFSAPMVPLGDPRPAADPFTIDCPERGTGRWVDTNTWAFDFARDLPAGIRCRFTLRPELKSVDGSPVGGERVFAFSTGGPAVLRTWPFQGSEWIH